MMANRTKLERSWVDQHPAFEGSLLVDGGLGLTPAGDKLWDVYWLGKKTKFQIQKQGNPGTWNKIYVSVFHVLNAPENMRFGSPSKHEDVSKSLRVLRGRIRSIAENAHPDDFFDAGAK